MFNPYTTARALAIAIKRRELGAEEITRAYLERIERYGGRTHLNAVCETDAERAITAARAVDASDDTTDKPLNGVPVLIKDNIDVMGLHTTAGSLALEDNIARRDADVVENLRNAGAIILGKTNMTEFANYTTQNMPGGYSSRGGQVLNAYDSAKNPSGSSSGSAVAMSAGLCAAAVGTDTSFSVIWCAAENGVTGLKPARGALSQRGIIPIAHTLDSAGALTRDIEDAVMLCAAMRGESDYAIQSRAPSSLKIAVNTHNRETVSNEQMKAYAREFDKWRRAGVHITEISQEHTPMQRAIMKYEFMRDLEAYLRQSQAKLKTLREIVDYYEANPDTMLKYGDFHLKQALEASGKLDDGEYIAALDERERLMQIIPRQIGEYDACVMTGPTNIMHFLGLPSLSIKMGLGDDNTPRGMILYGADEKRLTQAALVLERMMDATPPPNLD